MWTFILAYLFILVCSYICVYTEVPSDMSYEVNVKHSLIYISTGFTIDYLEVKFKVRRRRAEPSIACIFGAPLM